MAFQEKSAWIMSVALLLSGAFYFRVIESAAADFGQLAPPHLPVVIIGTIILVVVAVLGHIAIAVLTPDDANAPLDERENRIFDRAGHFSSYVSGAGIVLSLGLYLVTRSGDVLFYTVFGSLMLGQLAEYLIRIFLYRFVV